MNYNINNEINWINSVLQGQYDHLIAIDFVRELIAKSTENNNDIALIDIRQLSVKSNTLEMFEIGELLNSGKRSLNKIIMLCSKEHLKDDFLRTVLRNRGILLKATMQEEEARKWLEKFVQAGYLNNGTKKILEPSRA